MADDGRIEVDGCDTIPKLFWHQVKARDGRTAFREKSLGIWHATELARVRRARQGRRHGPGEVRFEPRPGRVDAGRDGRRSGSTSTWAPRRVGGVTNGIYPTDSAKQVDYILERQPHALPVRRERGAARQVPRDPRALPDHRQGLRLRHGGLADFNDPMVMAFDELLALGRAYDKANPGEWEKLGRGLAGRGAGDPGLHLGHDRAAARSAMLSHRNVIFQLSNADAFIPIEKDGEQLAFLPLCHVAERTFTGLPAAALGRHRQLRRERRDGAGQHPRGGAHARSSPCRASGSASIPASPSA